MPQTFDALRHLSPHGAYTLVRLCETCTQALLADLLATFPPMQEGETSTLEGAYVMGCDFRETDPEHCQMHPYLERVCP